MEIYHILNGDCLAEQLRSAGIDGKFIVMRECLVEGPVAADSQEEFFKQRESYLQNFQGVTSIEYNEKSVKEIQKLNSIPRDAVVYLWFENDLFCQANLWFVMSQLDEFRAGKLFRVFPQIPPEEHKWKGFGIATNELIVQARGKAVPVNANDLALGKELWKAFQRNDLSELEKLGKTNSNCFSDLDAAIAAHIDRFPEPGLPGRIVNEIISGGQTEFHSVFTEFSKRAGVYGFSDLQVRRIFDVCSRPRP